MLRQIETLKAQIPLSDAESFDADEWLGEKKDIWNHPRILSRGGNSHEVAQLMAEFANYYYTKNCQKK